MIPRIGQGRGFPRVGGGGYNYCRCPVCGYEKEHSRRVPCNRMRCPNCGCEMMED